MRGLVIAFALAVGAAGCAVDSLAENDWPCAADRPCAAGWVCSNGVCVASEEAPVVVPDVAAPDVAPDAGGSDAAPEVEEPGPEAYVVVSSVAAPGPGPWGLAVAPDGLWIGEATTRKVLRVTVQGVPEGQVDWPSDGRLRDLAYDPAGRVFALMAEPDELWVVWPEATRLTTESDVRALADDGETIFAIEGGSLARLEPSTGTSYLSTALQGSTAACSGLAAADGRVFRLCDILGQPTVDLRWVATELDEADPSKTAALDDVTLTVDVRPVTGFAAAAGGFWLTGWGYGAEAGRIVRLEVAP